MGKQEGGGVFKKLCFVLERSILPSPSLICIIPRVNRNNLLSAMDNKAAGHRS